MSIEPLKNYYYVELAHEYAAVNCESNVYKPGYGLFNGDNSVFRKFLYGKESFDYSLEYSKKFWKTYKNNKRFLRIIHINILMKKQNIQMIHYLKLIN